MNDNRPPTGGGTGRRRARARYASDAEVERAAALALKLGVALELDAAGGVKITGRLDSRSTAAPDAPGEGKDDAEGYDAWKQGYGAAGGQ